MKYNIAFVICSIYCLSAQVTFTELMTNPSTSEAHDEFVEIYNLSDSIIDLKNWRIADSTHEDIIEDFGIGMLLYPKRYAVILDGSYPGNSKTYETVIPDSVLIVMVDGGTIASSLSNTADQSLFLITASGDTIDRYKYVSSYQEGYSNEKIDLVAGNNRQNWGESLIEGGTPGRHNSIALINYDLQISLSIPKRPLAAFAVNMPQTISIDIKNTGKQPYSDSLKVYAFLDLDKDSVFSLMDEKILYENISVNLSPGDQINLSLEYTFLRIGSFDLFIRIDSPLDQNINNNRQINKIDIYGNLNSLHINEIKFLTMDNEPEWLELYNSGVDKIVLRNWAIADQSDTVFVDSALSIAPGQFKIIASADGLNTFYDIQDSLVYILKHMPVLNNSQDIISLINPLKEVAEQIPYTINWLEGEDWRIPSLEKINPQLDSEKAWNWGPSTHPAQATPGLKNTLFTNRTTDMTAKVSINPNPFSPDSDGHEDYTIIDISLPVTTARVRIHIYDIQGRKIRTLRDNSFSGIHSSVTWNGKDDSGRRMRMGIYIVFVQILNDRQGVLKEYKETVVLAGQL